MIVDVSKIVDDKFVIVAEAKKGTKIYLISEDKFISRFDDEEFILDSCEISKIKHDGVMVASLLSELQELEDTYIVSYIVDMYFKNYKIEEIRELILDELKKVSRI